jgi:hypothetical protein
LIAKEGNNTKIIDIRGRGVLFRLIFIKLYYKDINPEYNNFINKAHLTLNAMLNNSKLKRNLLYKRGYLKKFNLFITSYKTFLQLNN